MPIIVKLEAIMGSAGAMVHPTIKAIYETMNEMDTADVKLEGITKLLQYPEYSDVASFRDLMNMLEEKDRLLDVISSKAEEENDIHVYIGDESGALFAAGLSYPDHKLGDLQCLNRRFHKGTRAAFYVKNYR